MGGMNDFILELAKLSLEWWKLIVPLGVLYFQHLKSRTDLDIIAAKQRAAEKGTCATQEMYGRWYHRVTQPMKKINAGKGHLYVSSSVGTVTVEGDRQDGGHQDAQQPEAQRANRDGTQDGG